MRKSHVSFISVSTSGVVKYGKAATGARDIMLGQKKTVQNLCPMEQSRLVDIRLSSGTEGLSCCHRREQWMSLRVNSCDCHSKVPQWAMFLMQYPQK